MKGLLLGACVLILALFSTAQPLKEKVAREIRMQDAIRLCMTERNMTYDDMYGMEEIISNLYVKPGNEERRNKNGCLVMCVLKKQNLMKGSDIKEEDTLIKLDELFEEYTKPVYEIMRKCLEEARSITQECEKGFFINICGVKNLRALAKNREKHEKEESEEKVKTT